jgi:uncharacterized protein YecT (DUF1311 family)
MRISLCCLLACFALPAFSADEALDCEKAETTYEINQCAALDLEVAEAELQQYLQASLEQHKDDAELVAAIKHAQQDWTRYAKSHCDSVYTQWRDGTIRGVMGLSCQTMLTKLRSYELWDTFLTSMDSSPPLLPEPQM